ncbi:MAG: trehalose-6-phosphate synthase [Thermomicrobiales bacterium]|jgi:trehalose 6-phosphate synthase|nr:trehalose-6-phosphate synthase [Thermomicrobiales bacterium]
MTEPPAEEREGATSSVADALLDRALIVASNRGPVTFRWQGGKRFTSTRGSGGVVTAVSSIARERQPVWIACAMTEGDRKRAALAAEEGEVLITPPGDDPDFRLRFVVPDAETYHKYYNVIANPLLWFLQHYLWDTPRSPDITGDTYDAWLNGYTVVNQLFADEILASFEEFDQPPIVMLQDYHLYLTAAIIRAKRPDAIIQQFVHIPWPEPDYWRLLPMSFRRSICEGMLGNDIVGFQTPDHARSFLHTCEAYVPGVDIDYPGRAVLWDGRRIEVRTYPISIDVESVRTAAYSTEARSHDRYLPNYLNEYTVLRVDRAEPSKNIVRGFHAFDRMLELHPEFLGRVNFLAILVPSRLDVAEYQEYLDNVSSIVGRINAKYANVETSWQPIHLLMGENYPRALAAMKWYDVLLVNTIIDGMNLVAKEGCLLNERNGVLILSEGAGAAIQLGEEALMIAPADVEGTAEAIFRALTMPLTERRRRADNLRRMVEADDVATWFKEQLHDIAKFAILGERDPGSLMPDGSIIGPDGQPMEKPISLTPVVTTPSSETPEDLPEVG